MSKEDNKDEIKINDHPFYNPLDNRTERKILQKLVEICGFDTNIGIIDYFPDACSIQIGIIDNGEVQNKNKEPIFLKKTTISIYLNSKHDPIDHHKLDLITMKKILIPLLNNWIEVADFLIQNYIESVEKEKETITSNQIETCKEALKHWKELFKN